MPAYEEGEMKKALAFIKDPDSWPRWPLLPLKRGRDQHGDLKMDIGFLVNNSLHDDTVKPVVYEGNIFKEVQTPGQLKVLARYRTWRELFEDGWKVD